MIATAFTDLTTNDLWAEIDWLAEQPATPENLKRQHLMLEEIRVRNQRRQYLEDNFAWG